MGGEAPLSGVETVLVDANVFFAVGHPSNAKYQQFRTAVERADIVLQLPRRVVGELGGPETAPVRTALDEGWAEVVSAPDPTDGAAVAASDVARRTIANETGRPEHDVEKPDVILAGLAVQYAREHTSPAVAILTDDTPARRGIENGVASQGYGDVISVYTLADIIGDEPGEGIRLV